MAKIYSFGLIAWIFINAPVLQSTSADALDRFFLSKIPPSACNIVMTKGVRSSFEEFNDFYSHLFEIPDPQGRLQFVATKLDPVLRKLGLNDREIVKVRNQILPYTYSEGRLTAQANGNSFSKIGVEYSDSLGALRYSLPSKLAIRNASPKYVFLALPGFGASTSGAGSLFPFLTNVENRIKIPLHAETVDFPTQGGGPPSREFEELESLLNWFGIWLKDVRVRFPSSQIVIVGKSASGSLVPSIVQRFGNDIAAIIGNGSTHALPETGFSYSYLSVMRSGFDYQRVYTSQLTERERKKFDGRIFLPILYSFDWINSMVMQVNEDPENPWIKSDPFSSKPTLVILGEKDEDASLSAHTYFRDMASIHPNLKYVQVPKGPHDAFLESREHSEKTKKNYEVLRLFLNDLDSPSGE